MNTSPSSQGSASEIARAILDLIKKEPLTWPALQKKLARQMSSTQLREGLEALIQAKRIYRWPPLPGRRSVRFSVDPPDPKAYLTGLVHDFTGRVLMQMERLKAVGISVEITLAELRELLDQAPFPDRTVSMLPPGSEQPKALEAVLLSQIRHQQRHPGGLVSVRGLRQADAFHGCDKVHFDSAVLRLFQAGQVWLYRHDYPASLTETERASLVCDGQGNYYNGISLRD